MGISKVNRLLMLLTNKISFIQTFCLLVIFLSLSFSLDAKGVYLTVDDFVAETFAEALPVKKTLWLKGDIKQGLKKIFSRETVGTRQRYWLYGDKTAWIFNEIGKELPITIAVVVEADKIQSIKVLEYRESRGAEVRHDFFTQQFYQAKLDKKNRLDRSIDGISGATLSVWSMQRVARAALLLHKHVHTDTQ